MLHALTIGIDRFESPHIGKLRYARRDAEAVAALFSRIAEEERTVKSLVDEQATRKAVMLAVDDLADRANKNDVVVVYVASHGAPERRKKGGPASAYLVVHDTEYNAIHATGIDLDLQVSDWMARFTAPSLVLVLLDTCFSGAAGGRTFERRHMSDDKLPPVSLKGLELGRGRVIITAADEGELAYEQEALGHGVFTHHLLEAMKRPADGVPTLGIGALYDRVARAVASTTGGRQNPILDGRLNRSAAVLFPG